MNQKWIRLVASFLDEAADEFVLRGCSDWKWPKDWSSEERRAFALAIHEDNNGKALSEFTDHEKEDLDNDLKGEFGPPDWWVMRSLASWLRNDAL